MFQPPTARTFSIEIDAPASVVFDFIQDLRHMPRWSIHFCQSIRIEGDAAYVTSPSGEVYFAIDAIRATGVLDWWSGPSRGAARRWPTRVVSLTPSRSLYSVTALFDRPEDAPANLDVLFRDELGMIKEIVERG
jgi:hypothetical protein